VPVPAVLADLRDIKTLVLEDAGVEGMDLEGYVKTAEALARFNALDFSEIEEMLEPPMDAALWKWERELFREHCLKGRFGLELSPEVEAELEQVAAMLEKEPPALVHRDFQSTNVLWKDGGLKFIDFQGMRKGPALYDLASLVYDPYVRLSDRKREAIVKVYAQTSGRDDIAAVLPFAAVERLVQCLGAYGRLAGVGRGEFCRFVLPALENLLAAADEAGLDAVGALAEDLIAAEKRFDHKHCNCRK
jgi:aminoglycoside/choline kinase family phosphotransferase